MNEISELAKTIKNSKNICVFTGAGISCPSGIPDFRSADGLYNQKGTDKYTPEEIISHTFFVKHTDMFYKFYKSKMLYPNAMPNIAHKFFADIENENRKVTVVTQNIDGLHQQAGSSNVIELHGSVHRNYCTECGKFYTLKELLEAGEIPHCKECGGIIKPDVVLYEEPLDAKTVNDALNAVTTADTMIVVGTSLVVYPAASYVRYFSGDNLIIINKGETNYDKKADLIFNCDIVDVIKELKEII